MSAPVPDPTGAADPAQVGPYRLLRRLGAGGMGTVHLGADHAGRRVAVKLIRSDLARRPEFRDRLKREAESARRVARFCTAAVLDVNVNGDVPYLVTEFVDGPTLAESVLARGPLSHAELHQLAASMATALMAIHRAGIVHRDLKPGNILLSRLGPKVIDFGIARALDTASDLSRDHPVGTPAFMAPEQARGELVTSAADVFAWGGVLIYAATGHFPFGRGPAATLLYRVVNERPSLDGFEDSLRPLVEDAMRPDPKDRPTAEELYARLLDLRMTESSPPVGPPLDEVTALVEPVTPRTPGTSLAPGISGTPNGSGTAGASAVHSLSMPTEISAAPHTPATVLGPQAHGRAGPAPRSSAAPRSGQASEKNGQVPPDERHASARSARSAGHGPRGRRGIRMLAAALAVILVAVVVFISASMRDTRAPVDVPAQVAAKALSLQFENRPLARRLALASHHASPEAAVTRGAVVALVAADVDPLTAQLGGRALSAALRPDGQLLAAGTDAGTVELWDLSDRAAPVRAATIPDVGDWVYSVAFNPRGDLLAAGIGNGRVRLWDVSDPRRALRRANLSFHQDRVRSVAFAPEGDLLASGADDGQIALWSVSDPSNPQRRWAADGATAGIRSVAFAPHGHLLAFGGNDGTVRLWDFADPERPAARPALRGGEDGAGRTVQTVAFSPDGSTLAAGSIDGSVHLWSLSEDGAANRGSMPGGVGGVTSVGFSADGVVLASASEDDIVRLTDLSSRAAPAALTDLRGHTKAVNAVLFTPDARTVISAGGDGSIRLWAVDPAALAQHACADPANRITRQEWHDYFTNLPYDPPCAG